MKDSHTIGMKTAISIPDDIFEEVNKIARESNHSRSHVICLAVKQYLEKKRAQKLLTDLNKAYAGEETPDEVLLRKESKEYYIRNIIEKDDDDQAG